MLGKTTSSDKSVFGDASSTPGNYTLLGRLKSIVDSLQAIGSDTTPVPVQANIKSGNYAYSTLGSPNTTNSNYLIYSNTFVPTGEKIMASFSFFSPGGATIDTSGYVFLECDISGGTSYKPLAGSKILFSDLVNFGSRSFNTQWSVKGGNYRIVINTGTVSGTGLVGWNVGILN
jgi:hypothetical protein